jgi:hypothetical protein
MTVTVFLPGEPPGEPLAERDFSPAASMRRGVIRDVPEPGWPTATVLPASWLKSRMPLFFRTTQWT